MPTLMIQLPGLPPVAHVLKDETITVGRMKGNTIVIEDASVSLSHARITRKQDEFFLKDLNSTNGTVVNGQPIMEVKLNDLDRVRFADIPGQFLAENTEVAAPSPTILTVSRPALVVPSPATVPVPVLPIALPPRPRPALNWARLVGSAVGLVALGLVAIFGWKHWRADQPQPNKTILGAPARTVPAARTVASPALEKIPASDPASLDNETGDERVARLARALTSDDVAERRRAAMALHSLGTEAKAAIPALREALWGADEEVRQWAALTLIKNENYDPATIPILIRILQNDNATLRQVACLSLGIFPYEPAQKEDVVPALLKTATKDSDADVRTAALSALKIIAPDPGPSIGNN